MEQIVKYNTGVYVFKISCHVHILQMLSLSDKLKNLLIKT